jgi:hypothetical protein
MSLIRDYHLTNVAPDGAEARVINVVGKTIAIRRAIDAGLVRVKAYAKEGGALVTDNILLAGEKIRTAVQFTRIEITNLEKDSRNIQITAGDGDFQSDVVEGEVTVKTDSTNPLEVITREAKKENISVEIAHTSGSATMIVAPPNAIRVSLQTVITGRTIIQLDGAYIYLQKDQLFSTECSEDIALSVFPVTPTGTVEVHWVTQP